MIWSRWFPVQQDFLHIRSWTSSWPPILTLMLFQLLRLIGTSDHAVVCCCRSVSTSSNQVFRKVRHLFNKAEWDGLHDFYADYNWTSCESEDIDVHAENVTSVIQLGMDLFMPSKVIPSREKSAPWFNLPCLTAYSKKQVSYVKC